MQSKLPIYLVIEVSESMMGRPLEVMQNAIEKMLQEMKSQQLLLERLKISVIVYAGKAQLLVPLSDLDRVELPILPIGFGNSVSQALQFQLAQLSIDESNSKENEIELLKPFVFLICKKFTEDESNGPIARWIDSVRETVNLIIVSLGPQNNSNINSDMSKWMFYLPNNPTDLYPKLFSGLSLMLMDYLNQIEISGNEFMKSDFLEEMRFLNHQLPETQDYSSEANFLAKCQKDKTPYLIKYKKSRLEPVESPKLESDLIQFKLIGTFIMDYNFLELSDPNFIAHYSISTEGLDGFPSCPCCSNQWGFSVCTCLRIHCSGTETITTCPWCGKSRKYGFGYLKD